MRITLALLFFLGLRSVWIDVGSAGEESQMTLKTVVGAYVAHRSAISSVQANYESVQGILLEPGAPPLRLENPMTRVVNSGIFGWSGSKIAVRTADEHAVFDGRKTAIYNPGPKLGTLRSGCSGSLTLDWETPSSILDRFHDIYRTPISKVLFDAVTDQKFASAQLLPNSQKFGSGQLECYVIDGQYDPSKRNGSSRPLEEMYSFRLYLSPKHAMQMVGYTIKMVPSDRPIGSLKVKELRNTQAVWIPINAELTKYAFWKEDGKLRNTEGCKTVFSLETATLRINEPEDPELFVVNWPSGVVVDYQIGDGTE